MAGVTEEGFLRKPLEDIVEEKNTSMREIYGNDINLDPESTDGQMVGIQALSDDDLWQLAEAAYNNSDPDQATGMALSGLVKLNGITRQPATRSTTILAFTGNNGVVIPSGTLASDDSDTTFRTVVVGTIELGVANIFAENIDIGPAAPLADTLINLDSPLVGVTGVTNPNNADPGRLRETDAQLRLRRVNSVASASQNLLESLLGSIGDIIGITNVIVVENDSDSIDGNGVPAKSFECIVYGSGPFDLEDGTPLTLEVANTIWINKPLGIRAFGGSGHLPIDIEDSQSIPHPIEFTRPAQVPIYMLLDIITRDSFPSNGIEQLKDNILSYAAGTFGIDFPGFGVSDTVVWSELFTPINAVPGHSVSVMTIGRESDGSDQDQINLPMTLRELSQWIEDNLVIQVNGGSEIPVLDPNFPEDETVADTETANFNVVQTGGSPASFYQWYQNGAPVGTDSDSYNVIAELIMDGHEVYCDVTNAAGTAQSGQAILTVTP